jgi:acyl phosphate:glycerol-3-phosphate acyltransferase
MDIVIVTLYSYILGSIPFGLIFTRLAGFGDVRKIGSGNIGATNVLRTGNKFIAALTLLLDGLKGTLSIFITIQYFNELTYYSAVIVFLAHVFPVWLKFKGGKGVATFIGSLLVINFYLSAVFITAWLIMLAIFRISAVSALLGYLVVTVTTFIFFDQKIFLLIFFYFITSIFTHRQNITSLIKG